MKFWPSLLTVLVLILIVWFGVGVLKLYIIFGVGIPYLALIIFAVGFIKRLLKTDSKWSFPSAKPKSSREVDSSKWLWFGSVVFFGSLLIILLRHLRLFFYPVPSLILRLENLDSSLQIGFPHNIVNLTDIVFLIVLAYVLGRHIFSSFVKKSSVTFNYLPIFLLLGSVLSGIVMSYFQRVNIISVKEMTMGWVTFRPYIPTEVNSFLYIHIFLVSILAVYLVLSVNKSVVNT